MLGHKRTFKWVKLEFNKEIKQEPRWQFQNYNHNFIEANADLAVLRMQTDYNGL